MANQFEIYKCELCGNVIEVLFAGSGGPLSCCGQPMKLMADKAIDGAKEKHVPVIEANGAGCKVKVGSAPHVMEETTGSNGSKSPPPTASAIRSS